MQFNKNTHNSLCQCNKRWGHDFIRNKEEKYTNYWANSVEPSVNGRTHKAVNYPFCLLCRIIYFFQRLVGEVNAWGMEEYGSQIRIGKTHNCWKTNFCLWGKKTPTNIFTFHSSFTFFLSSRSWSLMCVFLHDFCCFPHFSIPINPFFLLLSGWEERFSRFVGLGRSFYPLQYPKTFCENKLLTQGWFPHLQFRFWLPNVFLQTQHLYFVVMCILVLVWKT